ncbi:hypothetical protein ACFCXA_16735 [Streptomyces virginiae]|uniref:hypothetical protein n=1 Tax=Streptomyces virginiae TaxID=1961 RepID=UPI0035E2B0E7
MNSQPKAGHLENGRRGISPRDVGRLAARVALRFRRDVAEVQVRAVSSFLGFDSRRGTRAVPGRVHTKDKKLVKQDKSGRAADIAGTGAGVDIPDGVIGNGRTGRARARPVGSR